MFHVVSVNDKEQEAVGDRRIMFTHELLQPA